MANAQVSSTNRFNLNDLVLIKSDPVYSDGETCYEGLKGKIGKITLGLNGYDSIGVEADGLFFYYKVSQLELVYES